MPPFLTALYLQVARRFPVDITYILLRPSDCSAESVDNQTPPSVLCRELDADVLIKAAHDRRFEVTETTLKSMREGTCSAIGAFNGQSLVGLSFFATGTVDPIHNRGGDRFRGIGFKLPDNVCYLFKVFVLPEYRRQHINQQIINYALKHYANKHIDTMVTTTDIGNQAYYTSVCRSGFQREKPEFIETLVIFASEPVSFLT